MLKQRNIFIAIVLVTSALLTGCSQSDGYSTSKNETIEVIHGYTLPPEPDKTINNSTLLGIDSNNNGVRDDVEIWILKRYKDKHPIYTEIAMQAGRARQKILEDPTKAREINDIVLAPTYCASYYRNCIVDTYTTIKIDGRINGVQFKKQVFNTNEREEAYWEYDNLLSGGSYVTPQCHEKKELCDFNTTKFEKIQ